MTTFKDFFKDYNTYHQNAVVVKYISNMTSVILGDSNKINSNITSKEAEKFSKKVNDYVYGADFIDEFSKNIDKPLENESEDDFVERAIQEMKKMLMKKWNLS